jgi:hypothetical protein
MKLFVLMLIIETAKPASRPKATPAGNNVPSGSVETLWSQPKNQQPPAPQQPQTAMWGAAGSSGKSTTVNHLMLS